jgi:uncharacterized cupredoxin-like copper-binding protein
MEKKMKPIKTVIVTSAICLVLGFAVSTSALAGKGAKGHGHADETTYGMPGNPKKKSRVVEILMKEGDGSMSFEPNIVNVKKGEQIRFKIKNVGELDHEIVIATLAENLKHAKEMARFPDMEHVDANAKRLKPKASGEILWRFSKAGEFDMSCLIPGHREAGMTGKVIVK